MPMAAFPTRKIRVKRIIRITDLERISSKGGIKL